LFSIGIKYTHGGVYSMNLKKIVRKVAAVGAGATMVGATLMGALATSLADYPSPFVSDGAFDAVMVVGDNAAAADIIGVTDIAMALQFSMKTTEAVSTDTGETTVVGGEVEDELSAGDKPFSATKTYDDTEIAVLKDSEFTYNGSDREFKETVSFQDDTFVMKSGEDREDFGTNWYLAVDEGDSLFYRWEFDDAEFMDVSDDSLEIEFLGMDLEITEFGTNQVTLSTATEAWMNHGESITATVKGTEYTITLDGVYSDTEAMISVNGVSKLMTDGDDEDFDFVDFELELVNAVNDDGTDNDLAKVKYGSTTSETAQDGKAAEMLGYGDDDSEAEWVWDISSTADNLTYIGVEYNQDRDRESSELSEDWELGALSLGESISFPNDYVQIEFAAVKNMEAGVEFTCEPDDDLNAWYNDDGILVFADGADVVLCVAPSEIFLVGGEKYEKVYISKNMSTSSSNVTILVSD